ncbi:hypothetical protein ACJX0J_010846, partial [Zea mays]
MVACSMRKSSFKVLEADIQHANTLAADFSRCACSSSSCSLADALGLLMILIYKVYVDGSTTTMSC